MAVNMVDGGQRGSGEKWQDMLWLAGRDMRRDWLAYVSSAVYMLVFGALIAPRGDATLGTWSPEIMIPIMAMLFAEPFLSREYLSWDNDRVAERLTFLRMFPIPLDVLVGGRMLAIIVAAVFNVPAFFIPMYLIGEWDLGALDYIWFALFWTGVSVATAGYGLCMEMGTSVKRYSFTNLGLLAMVIPAITVLGVAFDVWIVEGIASLMPRYGLLLALGSLALGAGVYLFCGRVSARLLRRRELTP